jgi:Protein of unknown function DUF72
MIRIGTSSWADPEFVRDWYPPKLPAPARLSWYAEHFDYVEVNSTFYAVPVKKVVSRWDSETARALMAFDGLVCELKTGAGKGRAEAAVDLDGVRRVDVREIMSVAERP